MSVLYLLSLVLIIYLTVSFIYPLKISRFTKVILFLLLLIMGSKFFVYRITGSTLRPNLDANILMVLEGLFAALIVLTFLCLLKDFAILLKRIFSKKKKHKAYNDNIFENSKKHKGNKFRLVLFSLMGLISLYLGLDGAFSQTKIPNIKSVDVYIANLPKSYENFKIVQLTDIHIGPILKGNYLEGIVNKTNSLNPDLVLLTGDLVDGSVDEYAKEFFALKLLHAKYGTYGVTGNHEYYSGAKDWIKFFNQNGLKILENSHVEIINSNFDKIVVAGVNDIAASRMGLIGPDVHAALDGVDPLDKVILLAHNPSIMSQKFKADLVLTGHTHGGVMIFLQEFISLFNEGFVSGLYELTDKTLYVSNGTGIWSGFSGRVLVDPEITLITLHAK